MPASIHVGKRRGASPHAVRIDLEKGDATYDAGERIRGQVVVQAAADAAGQKLSVELQAHAQGEVNALAVVAEQPLFGGAFRAGEVGTFPFELAAPRTAGGYQGRLFAFGLRLAAVLSGPGEASLARSLTGTNMDEMAARAYPAAARPLVVRPDARPLVVSLDPRKASFALSGRGAKVIVGLVLVLLGLGGLAVAGAMALGIFAVAQILWALLPGGLGALFAIIGLTFLFSHLGEWLAERSIGVPVIAVAQLPAGLDVAVRLAAGSRVSAVNAKIKVVEEITIEESDSTRTKEHVVGEQRFALAPRGEANVFGGEIPLAALAAFPPPVGIPGARIEWRLVLQIKLPWKPDWEDGVPLDAYPGGERTGGTATYRLTFD